MASLLSNGDFAQVDARGQPVAWLCFCTNPTDTCAVEDHELVLPSGCGAMNYVFVARGDQGIRMTVRASGTVKPRSFWLQTWGYETVEGEYAAPVAWGRYESAPISTAETNGYVVAEVTNDGAMPLRIQHVGAYQDVPNPPPKVASLVTASHHEEYAIAAGTDPVRFWLPLPADYASQVPLAVDLRIEPRHLVRRVAYEQDDFGNWGAAVDLKPDAVTDRLAIDWQALALVARITDANRHLVYQATTPVDLWTQASAVAESDDPNVAAVAGAATASATTPTKAMEGVIGWTSANIKYDFVAGFDASGVLARRRTTCTGFANLASAMGRAAGLPTRTIANILVGEAQQVHSINEFYLGPTKGWRRVEPQGTQAVLNEDYGFVIRVVEPSDEGPQNEGGIPYRTFTEIPSGAARTRSLATSYFPGCPDRLNAAKRAVDLRGDQDRLAASFDRARASWESDGERFHRRLPTHLRTLDDLEAWLAGE